MIGDRKKKETSFDLVRNWKRGNELNVGRDTKKKKGKKRKKARRLGRHSKGHLPGVATPARLRSLRVFAPENSRSSYVTGSRGRSYGEVTMREDGCRLSDATLDKYLRCAPLPLQRFASRLPNRVSARIFRGSFKGTVPRVVAFSFSLFFLFFLRDPRRETEGILRDPPFFTTVKTRSYNFQCSCVAACVVISFGPGNILVSCLFFRFAREQNE